MSVRARVQYVPADHVTQRSVSLGCAKPAVPQTLAGPQFSPRLPQFSPRAQDVVRTTVQVAKSVKDACHAPHDALTRIPGHDAVLRVLCYGDSNTAGFCSKGKKFEPYARSLEAALLKTGTLCKVNHAGLSGLTASELADKMDHSSIRDICGHEHQGLLKLVKQHQPDIVIIMAGTNDLAAGVQPEQILQHIVRLHDVCHQDGIPTIALAPPQAPSPVRDALAAVLKNWAGTNTNVAAFRDAEELVPRVPFGFWEPDVIHFSPSGSWTLGQKLGPIIAQCSKKAERPRHFRHALGGA